MKKQEIAHNLAAQAGISQGEAADQVDRLMHRIAAQIRAGKPVRIPGLGKVSPPPAVRK
ncbi:MAG: HU family DNA-binding protein [Bryobacteraceae bacterium]|nr:HU family DNA-binding protein [Bryobacteraceae bacterium]